MFVNPCKKLAILLLILFIPIGMLVSCQYYFKSEKSASTSEPGVAATQEPIHWVTIAPMTTHTPTPTIQPLQNIPKGRIAFQSERDGNLEIYLVNADGTFLSRLTNNPAVDVFPAWSPAGDQLLFTSDRNGNPDIYRVNADGSGLVQITNNPAEDALPAWSPDGKRIVFTSNRNGNDEIYVMNLDGSNLKQLTNNSAMDAFPTWSPDGTRIAFTTDRDVNLEIYVVDADGTNLIRLTNDPAKESNPAWSPDGKRIAFISDRDGHLNLYTMDSDGGNVIQVTHFKASVEKPGWSPDGQFLVFASDLEGNRDIYITDANGNGLLKITTSLLEDFYPAWSSLKENLNKTMQSPTLPAKFACRVSSDPTYGYSQENPVKLGFDPRLQKVDEEHCLIWLTGPTGEPLQTELLEELHVNGTNLCKVSVTYPGQAAPAILYFDLFNYQQPLAPKGFLCGSEIEYSKAISSGLQQGSK
jgi:TolB protein